MAMYVPLEHLLFNNHWHEYCPSASDDWCKFKNAKSEEDCTEVEKSYRIKETDGALYIELKNIIRRPQLSDEKLLQLHHGHNTPRCEGMMQSVTKAYQKNKTYSKKICYKGRCVMAVGINSVGLTV
jgi:hypothetical protein